MGRAPCCDKANVKRGPWSPEEDAKLKEFIDKFGTGGNWISLPQKAGLKRCGKSCRLRWLNYLRPNIKHGEFSDEEDRIICTLYASIGSRWSIIAAQLPGRTDNDIKNYWNTKLKKKLISMINPIDQRKLYPQLISSNALQTSSSPQSLYEAVSVHPSNLLYNNNNNNNIVHQYSYLLQNQEMLNINPPMQFYSPGGKDTTNMLVFGGGSHDQGSCSSSDGSCSQISYGKEIKQEPYNGNFHHHQGYNNISSNNNQENHEFVLDYGNNIGGGTWNINNNNQKQNVFPTNNNSSVNQLEYDLEEVKQLISSSSNNNNNNNNIGACNNSSFFITSDENNKAQHDQRGMFYY